MPCGDDMSVVSSSHMRHCPIVARLSHKKLQVGFNDALESELCALFAPAGGSAALAFRCSSAWLL
eukprot:3035231-Pleurochrysis_carterae.AAC.1